MKETVKLAADQLRPGSLAFLFCTAQRFAVWNRLFAPVPWTQHNGFSFSSSSGSKTVFMVSAAPLMFLENASRHRSNLLWKSCALFTAVESALQLKKDSRMLAEEEEMASYKHLGFVSSAFAGYRNDISDV